MMITLQFQTTRITQLYPKSWQEKGTGWRRAEEKKRKGMTIAMQVRLWVIEARSGIKYERVWSKRTTEWAERLNTTDRSTEDLFLFKAKASKDQVRSLPVDRLENTRLRKGWSTWNSWRKIGESKSEIRFSYWVSISYLIWWLDMNIS